MSDTRPAAAPATGVRELRYEGFPLEAVLARVHAAHGADVTITGADRVRRGGIGGFFARELFQVTVTVPVPGAADAADDLTFHQLGRISIFDDAPVVLGPEADELDEIDPEDIEGALALTPAPARDAADDEIWALLAAATASHREPAPAPVAVAPEPVVATPAPAPVPAPVVEALVAEVVPPIETSGPIASTTLIPASTVAGTPFDPALLAAALSSTPTTHPVVTSLPPSAEGVASGLALPAEIVHPVPAAVDLDALLRRFDAVPPASALPPAGIIAVVGTRIEALEAAGALAGRLGIATEQVIVASPPADIVLPTHDETMRLAATTRYRCNPIAVIVVELVPGRQGHEWVRAVLDGLRAEQVRFVADATRLLSHQHLSIPAVGGVDVIDLLGATDHPDPADALNLSTPVGSIDGRPATADLWAATVLASRAATPATVDRVGMIGR